MTDPSTIRDKLARLEEAKARRQQSLGAVAEIRKQLPKDFNLPADATADRIAAEAKKAEELRDRLDAQLAAADADLTKRFPDLMK